MREKLIGKLIGYVISWLIIALILYWYNYIIFYNRLPFWKILILAVPFIIFLNWFGEFKIGKILFGLLFSLCVFAQICKWLHIIYLPLQHYFYDR